MLSSLIADAVPTADMVVVFDCLLPALSFFMEGHSAAPNGQGAPARSAQARSAGTSGASIREASVLVCDALKALGVHCVTPESLRLAKVEDSAACAPR